MLVRRSEVSAFCSIHRDSRVTGEKAISASFVGSAIDSAALRTNLIEVGTPYPTASAGLHRVAGATRDWIATLRGPVRRSSSGAIDRGQLAAATWRSDDVMLTRASFSASSNVDTDTGGPDTGPVPKVGGAPAVVGGAAVDPLSCPPRHATAAAIAPIGAVIRNLRR